MCVSVSQWCVLCSAPVCVKILQVEVNKYSLLDCWQASTLFNGLWAHIKLVSFVLVCFGVLFAYRPGLSS